MQLQTINVADLDKIFEIMKQSFPIDEYRPFGEQKTLIKNKKYTVYKLCRDEDICGFVTVWHFPDFDFVEHLAVADRYRNGGLGARILSELRNITPHRLCLEVEPPDTAMAKRRIGFYERNGFYLNAYPYLQPAYSKERSPVALLLMTTSSPLDEDEFERIKSVLYREVYGIM